MSNETEDDDEFCFSVGDYRFEREEAPAEDKDGRYYKWYDDDRAIAITKSGIDGAWRGFLVVITPTDDDGTFSNSYTFIRVSQSRLVVAEHAIKAHEQLPERPLFNLPFKNE